MPRGKIALTEEQKRRKRVEKSVSDLENYIRKITRKAHVTQADCADALGMTQSGYSYALSHMTLRADQLMTIIDLAGGRLVIGEEIS